MIHRFLLVKFQLDYILAKAEPRQAIKALNALPKDMAEAYIEVLARIEQTNGKEIAIKVLSWLFHSRRPMKMRELQEALSIETHPPDSDLNPLFFIDPIQIIHYCQGLVELDKSSGIIRFTHYTVEDFLKDRYLNELLPPTYLAKVCLTYLTFDCFETGPASDKDTFFQRMELYALTDYAMRYWGSYVRGKGEKDQEIVAALFRLFKSTNQCNAIRQRRVWMDYFWKLGDNKTYFWTPLHIIAQEGLTEICNLIISKFGMAMLRENLELGTVDSRDEDRETPLFLAASEGHLEICSLLLGQGADFAVANAAGQTVLHQASWGGHRDVVELLLGRGADFAVADNTGWTALHLASSRGHRDVVELLLGRGADFAVADNTGWTALHQASWEGHRDVVELLLGRGADFCGAQRPWVDGFAFGLVTRSQGRG